MQENFEFDRLLRERRITRQLGQEELGFQSGLNRNAIERYESGRTIPQNRFVIALADVLGLNEQERAQFLQAASRAKIVNVTSEGSQSVAVDGHAFISYVREDSDEIDKLERDLKAAGIAVWRDVRNLWPGQDWKREIQQAIEHDSCAFIACFSNNSRARIETYQWEELTLAAECFRRRPPDRTWIYPVRLDDGPVADLDLGAGRNITGLQRADLFGPDREGNVNRLIISIRRSLGVLAVADAQPPQAQPPKGQPEVHAEDPQQTEKESEDAGPTKGTAKPQDADTQGEPQRDIGRTAAGIMAFVVAVGCFAWLIIDQSLPLLAVVAITALAAVAAGAAAWLLVPRTIDPPTTAVEEVGVAVIALIAALLAIPPRSDPGAGSAGSGIQSPSSSPASSPAAPSTSPPSTRSPTEVLFDDFNSKLDDDKNWILSPVYDSDPKQLPKQIYTEGGRLHLKVSPENSLTGANAELKAIFPSLIRPL